MSNYNKHINSFTDYEAYQLYVQSDLAAVPNVAYVEDDQSMHYRKILGPIKSGKVGGIYYSDDTVTGPDDAVDTSKTPIGVIIQAPTIENKLKTIIMSLYDIKSDGTNSPNNSNKCYLGISGTAASKTDNPEIPNDDNGDKDISVYSGKEFTKVLVDKYGSDAQAAYACSIYSTEGTEAGNWYLPSASELKQLCSNNYTVINNTLTKLKNVSKGYTIYSDYYWSSSEYSSHNARTVNATNGNVYTASLKYHYLCVRAVLAV